VIFTDRRATKWALVGVSLLSAADIAAFDFFCAQFGQGQKSIRFACLSLNAVIFTALKSLRRSTANASNHWHHSLRNTDENHAPPSQSHFIFLKMNNWTMAVAIMKAMSQM
jgi:hypothetical protein